MEALPHLRLLRERYPWSLIAHPDACLSCLAALRRPPPAPVSGEYFRALVR